MSFDRKSRLEALEAESQKRILVLDGAMGTMIQRLKPSEEDYRGERFADWGKALKGNNDLLNLTRPDAIRDIHVAYFEAGADLIETNTFSATTIAQADYEMEELAAEIAREGARQTVFKPGHALLPVGTGAAHTLGQPPGPERSRHGKTHRSAGNDQRCQLCRLGGHHGMPPSLRGHGKQTRGHCVSVRPDESAV
ncbi:putative metionine synthase, homocysteine S-methyltransferase subunit [Glycocaulis alkaliphilus]|uniref:Putative metionine synthase, homocysteine S-methyltransferase subunit n=1 Tax=Glycocaulis alkaliphilus TaxID=1434191 RepID=A0A3T0E6W9_9PROT|nr:homocysteine S-methyltransferase family protein [Glycocaulis alkaliphilus]AZU03072.1 putative metionine synthase, homocysteine S-methyltransferase subunit [Glycocaulis alkaliphilus]GGB70769.1 hypothetical protein GCM10007417_08170 [Glycocaulis alkaliphilus]